QTNAANIAATVSTISQSGLQPLVDAINQQTGTTGVTATVNSSNQLVLTEAQGNNISITGFAGTGTLAAGGTSAITLGTGSGQKASATVQAWLPYNQTKPSLFPPRRRISASRPPHRCQLSRASMSARYLARTQR